MGRIPNYMRRHADTILTGMVGVGSAVAAAFAPALLKWPGIQQVLALVGLVFLIMVPFLRRWNRKRSGTAVVVWVHFPEWGTGWDLRAIEFADRTHASVFPVRKPLQVAPSSWPEVVKSVRVLLDYLFREAQPFGFDPGRVSMFVAAPWWVSWAIGAPFGHHTNLDVYDGERSPEQLLAGGIDVYDQYSDHSEGFFLAGHLQRDRKTEVDHRDLVSTKLVDLGGATDNLRAIVLKLGSHDLVPDAVLSARKKGAVRALVVEERYASPGYLHQTTANFERLAAEVFTAVKEFLDTERRVSEGERLTFMVYASLPVSVAFLLGAHLSVGTDFVLMHWDDPNQQYVEAKVR